MAKIHSPTSPNFTSLSGQQKSVPMPAIGSVRFAASKMSAPKSTALSKKITPIRRGM